jgi:hypothetical protein
MCVYFDKASDRLNLWSGGTGDTLCWDAREKTYFLAEAGGL